MSPMFVCIRAIIRKATFAEMYLCPVAYSIYIIANTYTDSHVDKIFTADVK